MKFTWCQNIVWLFEYKNRLPLSLFATDDSRVLHVETRHTPCHNRGTEDPSISRLFFFDSSFTYLTVLSIKGILKVKEVKWSRYRPGVAQRVGRGIALFFHDRGTRRGWVVSSTLRPHFTPGKDPVPIVQEAGCPQGRSGWAENIVPTGIRY